MKKEKDLIKALLNQQKAMSIEKKEILRDYIEKFMMNKLKK